MTTQLEERTAQDIFSKGVLIQLSTSVWGGTKQIDKDTVRAALGSDYARGKKLLLDPKTLKPIASIRNAARAYIEARSLPFPIKGVMLVPLDYVNQIDSALEQYQEDFESQVWRFSQEYEVFIERAKIKLGSLYDSTDYPRKIDGRFRFSWRFFMITTPDTEGSLLDPQLVAREKRKFLDTMEETRQLGVTALREEFMGLIKSCTDRLKTSEDGRPMTFHKSTMTDNFLAFFDTFKSRNIFEDTALAEIIEKAKKVVQGIDIETLRWDEDLREKVKKEMNGVAAMVESCIKAGPSRKLKIN